MPYYYCHVLFPSFFKVVHAESSVQDKSDMLRSALAGLEVSLLTVSYFSSSQLHVLSSLLG